MLRVFGCLIVAAVLLICPTGSVMAQQYPLRPITVVVPFAAGGPTDVLARILGQHMSETLGQQIVVENVTGAGGSIGAARVAKAAPDGYTLVMGNLGTHAASVGLYKNLSYDPRKDFEPVMLVATTPMVLVVRKTLQVDTLKDFIAYAAANPNKLTFGSAGTGSISHLTYLLFTHLTKTEIQHVPYRGLSQVANDLLAGQIDMTFDQVVSATPHIRAGSVKPIVVTASSSGSFDPECALRPGGGIVRPANNGVDSTVLSEGNPATHGRSRQWRARCGDARYSHCKTPGGIGRRFTGCGPAHAEIPGKPGFQRNRQMGPAPPGCRRLR